MSRLGTSNSKRTGPKAEPGHHGLPMSDGPSEPDIDHFAAAFAAARGTVSPELDLNGVVDEPVVTGDDADVGHRCPGS